MCSDTMTVEEVRAAVAAALESDDFPGYFLYCQVGISGARSNYEWVDASGRLWDRWGFELEWECALNERGWDLGKDDWGSEMRRENPRMFAAGVDSLIADKVADGELFPLYYAD
nr:MAG TPA: hypothetical protein [Caudoviricetes sp.]